MGALKNPRHEKYVQNLVSGMSQRLAYRDAFPKSKSWKDTTVDSKASELFGKVVERYNEILAEQKDDALFNALGKKESCLQIMARDADNQCSDRIKAIDTDNRMENEYAAKNYVEDNDMVLKFIEGMKSHD